MLKLADLRCKKWLLSYRPVCESWIASVSQLPITLGTLHDAKLTAVLVRLTQGKIMISYLAGSMFQLLVASDVRIAIENK